MQQQVDGQLSSKWRECKTSLQAELKLINSLEKDKAAFAAPSDTTRLPANRCAQVWPRTDQQAAYSCQSSVNNNLSSEGLMCLQPSEPSHTSAWQSRKSEPDRTDEGFQPDFTIHVVRREKGSYITACASSPALPCTAIPTSLLQALLQPNSRSRQRASIAHSDSWSVACDSMHSPRVISQTADPNDPEVHTASTLWPGQC